MRSFSIEYNGSTYTLQSNTGSQNIAGAVPRRENSLAKQVKRLLGFRFNNIVKQYF